MRFPLLTAPTAMPGLLSAVSLRKSHDIVILSFCNIVKGQAKCFLSAKTIKILTEIYVYVSS